MTAPTGVGDCQQMARGGVPPRPDDLSQQLEHCYEAHNVASGGARQ